MKDHDRQNRDHLEKEVSPAGQMADKRWKRTNWLVRLGVCAVILTILVVSFGPYCVYRYGQHQLDQEMYAEAASTFEWLRARTMFPPRNRVPSSRGYRDCYTKILECHYRLGLSLMEEGDYEQAKEEFLISIHYDDSAALIEECNRLIYGE